MTTLRCLGLFAPCLPLACATPCVDDGLRQSFCPGAATDTATGGASVSASAASADGSGTDSASVTAGASASGSASASASDSASASASATDSASATASDGETESDSGDMCPVLDDSWEAEPPTFVLLVDQSGSMNEPFDAGGTRWEVLGQTLLDPDVGVVAMFQDQIRFSLVLYTNTAPDPTCPELIETVAMVGAYDEIAMTFAAATPEDDTPTGDSLAVVADALAQDPTPGEKVIVLVTDGEPDTCAAPDPQNGQPEAIAAAEAAFAQGLRTVMVSVGADVSNQHMQDMANAGAGVGPGDPDAAFYVALDQMDLADAFRAIINSTRPCQFQLEQMLMPDQAESCAVTVNGDNVALDEANGWWPDGTVGIDLVGDACTAIQAGPGTVEMVCDCGALQGR